MSGLRQYVKSRLATTQFGLEIGASYSPIAPRREGFNVRIVDHADADELRLKYASQGMPTSAIEDVDAIDDGGEFTALLEPGADGFDYIIASHVFEHLPNPIAFLQRCGRALSDDGVLYLLLPDRRHTFDYLRPTSTMGQMVDAFIEGRERHSIGTLVDHMAMTATRGNVFSWRHDEPTPLNFTAGIDADTIASLRAASGEYIDCHAWIFTPSSARLLIADLRTAGLSPLHEIECRQDEPNEFLLVLSRTAVGALHPGRLALAEAALTEAMSDTVATAVPVPTQPVYALPPRTTSAVPMPMGMVSPNGNITLGREGQLFLVEGTNNLLSQFERTSAEIAPEVERWRTLVATRRDHAASVGSDLFQMVIPEKLSTIPQLFPREIGTPSAMFKGVEDALADLLGDRYISTIVPLRALGTRAVRAGDTHLSPEGCAAALRAILAPVAAGVDLDVDFTGTGKLSGDMFAQFFNFEVPDIFATPSEHRFPVPRLMKQIESQPGRHQGQEEHWTNPGALIDRSVLVFGNSFFASEALGPAHLGWWFARLFREYHFVWTPRYFADTVSDIRPDIVLCQTVERFLPSIPVDAMPERHAAFAAG